MKIIKLTITLLLFIFIVSSGFAQKADDIIGQYHLPNKIEVEIFKQNEKYCGKIVKLNDFEDGQTRDVNNPEKSKRNDLLIGKIIITNLEFDENKKQWLNGSMYGAEKGMIFNLKIIDFRDDEIVVVGSKLIFWKTLIWEKIVKNPT